MKINKIAPILIISLVVFACDRPNELEYKKSKLKDKKKELAEIRKEIKSLENEISIMDPEFAKANRKAKLVTTLAVEKTDFEHFIEVSGSVKSRKNVDISSETIGSIKEIRFKEGDEVVAGQVIILLDKVMLTDTYDEVKTQYDHAKTMFERQEKLWKQDIGTEVQYLEAKNRKQALEKQLKSLQSQIDKTFIKAPFSGTIDEISVRVGQLAQPGFPLLRLVSLDQMYINVEVSEAYVGKFQKGDMVEVEFPATRKGFDATISAVGQIINPDNRTFIVEVEIPEHDYVIKPNLITVVMIKDFEAQAVAVVPTNLIQKDNHGDFVYIVEKNSEQTKAKKVQVERGATYKNRTMIANGLIGTEILVDKGFKEVIDGAIVKIVESNL